MKQLFLVFTLLGAVSSAWAQNKTGSKENPCAYPAAPINWIVRYCGFVAGTDDEIAIQESKCFKDAQIDLKNTDECVVKKKFKTKTCEFMMKEKFTNHKLVADCLSDKTVKPYFSGGD
jgi:hypothetical protein